MGPEDRQHGGEQLAPMVADVAQEVFDLEVGPFLGSIDRRLEPARHDPAQNIAPQVDVVPAREPDRPVNAASRADPPS
jgi:hypothetical protein